MKNKTAFIETSYILKNKTGIGAYTLKLMQVLEELNIKYITQSINLILPYKYMWQTIWLNTIVYFMTLIKKPDIFISPNFIMPFFTRKGTKYVTVIHDLCFLRNNEMAKYNSFVFELSTKIAIKKADIIVTVSESVKQELISKYNICSDKIKVIYNSIANYIFDFENKPEVLDKYNIQDKKYILSVATMNKRKNIPKLIKAFESISDKYPDIKLVLVGGMGNEQRENLTKHKNIIFTGYIQDEELPTLYNNALMYVYPSLYEGFGIPLIEAQYCNCPVLCTDIPIFREIAKNSAEFCESNANSIAQKIDYLINNPQRLEELTELGNKNVKRFDVEIIKKQLEEIINV